VHLLQGAPLLAILAGLGLEPLGQLLRKRIEPAAALALGVRRLLVVAAQVLPDGVARQAGAPGHRHAVRAGQSVDGAQTAVGDAGMSPSGVAKTAASDAENALLNRRSARASRVALFAGR